MRFAQLAVVLTLAFVAGCSQGTKLVPATGVVKSSDGKPLGGEGAQIEFRPVDPAGKPAAGEIAEDGTFSLKTGQDGAGALPGEY